MVLFERLGGDPAARFLILQGAVRYERATHPLKGGAEMIGRLTSVSFKVTMASLLALGLEVLWPL